MDKTERLTVLVVDDEDDVRRFMQMVLSDAGFDVRIATNGTEALDRIREKVPDLISLDVVMPGGSGVKLYRELKKNPAWSKIPVLVVTGHAKDEFGKADFREMTMSGPGVYLEKPVTAATYVNAVQTIMGGASGSDDASPTSNPKEEAKALLDSSDPETVRRILDMLKSKKEE